VDQLRRADALEPASPQRAIPWRRIGFLALLAAYLVVTLGVIFRSPIIDLDHAIQQLHLQRRWHGWYPRIEIYVMLGQRAPSTLVALPWIAWCAWRARSPRPLVLLATGLIVLNLSVGVVKVITGRIGPLATRNVHDVFAGGNIYPSGHVSNTVVLYGVIAMLAVKHRKLAVAAAVWVTVSVGLCTLYLNTHWFSDVLGGWLAGSLVLVALPWVMPYTEWAAEAVIDRIKLAWRRRRLRASLPPVPDLVADDALPTIQEPVGSRGGSSGRTSIPVLSARNGPRRTIDAR
jgi:membrane-associated phospholipid phosphatase